MPYNKRVNADAGLVGGFRTGIASRRRKCYTETKCHVCPAPVTREPLGRPSSEMSYVVSNGFGDSVDRPSLDELKQFLDDLDEHRAEVECG